MKQKNGSGSSEHLNSQIDVASSIKDEDPLDHDKMVSRASSSSFSSSSSVSSSCKLVVNGGKNDVTFPEIEENDSILLRSNQESPSTTPKASTSQESERLTLNLSRLASPRFSDYDSLNASPIQSPPIQVMTQSDDYDSSRIPSSIFSPKPSDDSDWSVASNESLFSIQMGNSSFSMDSDYFISQSGKLHWLDDGFEYSCFTPNGSLASPKSMVVETKAEDERKSTGLKEEFLNASSPDMEGRQSSSPYSRVPDGNGASPSNSDSSSESACSFAFPVIAGESPVKEDAGKPESPPRTPKGAAEAETTAAPATTPNAGGNQWFNCFSCFPICC